MTTTQTATIASPSSSSIPSKTIDPNNTNNEKSTTTTTTTTIPQKIKTKDIFLTSEERYEVYNVKVAERPHLLHLTPPSPPDTLDDDDEEEEEEEEEELPLIDGCDIPGWRYQHLSSFPSSSSNNLYYQGVLGVGIGSMLLRRESQWPIFYKSFPSSTSSSSSSSSWDTLRNKLLHPPCSENDAVVLDYNEYSASVAVDEEEDGEGTVGGKRNVTKFAWEYERKNIPAKIMGATTHWKAMPKQENEKKDNDDDDDVDNGWTFENLLARFPNIYFRFSDNHGEMLTLSTYSKYIHNPEGLTDDSPLAIYDAEFGKEDSPITNVLLEEYNVPKCFSGDLFDLAAEIEGEEEVGMVGGDVVEYEEKKEEEYSEHVREHEEEESAHSSTSSNNDIDTQNSDSEGNINEQSISTERPPYQWILIGPARSGTGMHIDPLWTNAWVTILQGLKRWMLFPPCTPPEKVGMVENQPQIPSSTWFRDYYHIVTDEKTWPREWKPVEVLQKPGETVFVPNGWAHVVLNLECTVAVTHNYASEFGPFERMWEEVAVEESEFAVRWYSGMKKKRPDLARRVWRYHEKCRKREEESGNGADGWAFGLDLSKIN